VKVLIRPKDERMRELISLRAFGLSELDAVRYYVAMKMAERGLVSAPNMAVGAPFNIGYSQPPTPPFIPNVTVVPASPAPSRAATQHAVPVHQVPPPPPPWEVPADGGASAYIPGPGA
jgi:hypothetical protein